MSEYATTENVNRANWRLYEDGGPFVVTSAQRLAGNMNPKYDLPAEGLRHPESPTACVNMRAFHEWHGLRIDNAYVLRPQGDYSKGLNIIDVDSVFQPGHGGEDATDASEHADFIYTKNTETLLECKPGDCPVLTIYGTMLDDEPILGLLHVGWQGLNAGYLENAINHITQELSGSIESLRIQMSGAAYAKNFHYENAEHPLLDCSQDRDQPKRFTHPDRESLFINVWETGRIDQWGQPIWSFDIDMPGFIRSKLKELGVTEYQLFEEGSDTASPDSAYSSHSRAVKEKSQNTRDVVVATMGRPNPEMIMAHYAKYQGRVAVLAALRTND